MQTRITKACKIVEEVTKAIEACSNLIYTRINVKTLEGVTQIPNVLLN